MNDANEVPETAPVKDRYIHTVKIKGRRPVALMRLASAAGATWKRAVYMDRAGRYWLQECRDSEDGRRFVSGHRIVSEVKALAWALHLWTSDHVRGRERMNEALEAGAFARLTALLRDEEGSER